MLALILSRVAAIAILAIPVGYLIQEIDDRDWQTIQDYSHEELLAYLESARLPSHVVSIAVVFLIGCGVIACVEVLAWLLRLPFRKHASTAS
ncbi:MAG: hypothetical protein WD738_22900 [Pirellulales bacterium]